MIILETERLRIRNWTAGDGDLFHEINSDPKVMEFFPARRSRAQSDAFLEYVKSGIEETGYGFTCLEDKQTGRPIGFCGLAYANLAPIFPADTIEIGWRLALPFWGRGYVTEAARALLKHGFETRGLAEIVSFAVAANRRSTAVMERIGLVRDPARDFDHPRVPAEMPHIRRCVVYALDAAGWQAL